MFKIFYKSNKKRLFYLLLIVTVISLVITMIGSVNATTYTITKNNSTSSINDFFDNEDYENHSPLAKGDTVIFKEGKYNLDLNINKAITLKTNGKVIVKSISIFKNTKISGFVVNGDFNVRGKFNTINKNNIKGFLDVSGSNNLITNNKIKGQTYVYGINNIIKNNNIFDVSQVYGGRNKVISNKFKKNVEIGGNGNKITNNKLANNYKIMVWGKKNILKNNKQSYMDLALNDFRKTTKGHILSVKNVGTKSSLACYIRIDNYDKTVYKIKIRPLKKGKSTKVIISKWIINKLKYRYYETTYYGGYIYLDYKNKNKDVDLSNNQLELISYKKGYRLYVSMM